MSNQSILAAFERMWQHVVALVGKKANIDHTHEEYYTETEVDGKLEAVTNEVNSALATKADATSVPTKTSDLTNDSGFITSVPVTSVNGETGAVTIDVPTKTSQLENDSGYITSAPDEIYVGDGDMPTDATIQIILDGEDEEQALKDELKDYIDEELQTTLATVYVQLAVDTEQNIVSSLTYEEISLLSNGQKLIVAIIEDGGKVYNSVVSSASGLYTVRYISEDGYLKTITIESTATSLNTKAVGGGNLVAGDGIVVTKDGDITNVAMNMTVSQTDITAGETPLDDGQLYFVYT